MSLVICAVMCKAGAEERPASAGYSVNLHISTKIGVPVQAALLWDSEDVATFIFSKIGVDLIWRTGHSKKNVDGMVACADDSAARDISIDIVRRAPPMVSNVALAMAIPYADSGVRIMIFWERVDPLLRGHHAHAATVLGYVLAHEIAHVLQGEARHSQIGVMRARWTENDFTQMGFGTLTFTDEDVNLMRGRFGGVCGKGVKPSCFADRNHTGVECILDPKT